LIATAPSRGRNPDARRNRVKIKRRRPTRNQRQISRRSRGPICAASPVAGVRPAPSVARPPRFGYRHKRGGHEPPTISEAVKAVLRGIRRTIGSAKQGKAPATADLIGQMVELCSDSMIGKRDRALLRLGFCRGVPA
jgi:hypothetical protein